MGRAQTLIPAAVLLGIQIVFIILYSQFVEFDVFVRPGITRIAGSPVPVGPNPVTGQIQVQNIPPVISIPLTQLHSYTMFQDTHVMIFVGFGFLMTFLRRYGYGAVGFNFLLGALAVQWAILCQGFMHARVIREEKIHVTLTTLLNADIAAATVLIAFGAVLGRTTPLQLIFMAMVEMVIFAINEYLVYEKFKASDIGGSIVIHTFGAIFALGLAVGTVKRGVGGMTLPQKAPNYSSNLFSMIGTLFLWVYWPSFNAALAVPSAQEAAIVNTYLSLAASVVSTFAITIFVHRGKISMDCIQNATLAGGVGAGAVCDLLRHPFGAIVVGSLAGAISTCGFRFVTPVLEKKFGISDTCGVLNLHGTPGILSAIASAIILVAEYLPISPYGEPSDGGDFFDIDFGVLRSFREQAVYQIIALAVTMIIALVSGIIIGFIMRFLGSLEPEDWYEDGAFWESPEQYEIEPEPVKGTLFNGRISDTKV